jgi:hypothetical protein
MSKGMSSHVSTCSNQRLHVAQSPGPFFHSLDEIKFPLSKNILTRLCKCLCRMNPIVKLFFCWCLLLRVLEI